MSASQTRAAGPRLPSRAELNQATKATAAAIADPNASVQDIQRAAELEAATLHAYWQTPGAQAKAELEREPEAVAAPDITDAELALIRAELAAGLPIPDTSEPSDVAIWRAEHAAELREPEAGQ